MSTLPLNPEFTSGALERQVEDFLDEKYPHVAVRNGVPYIPGQYIARFQFPNRKQLSFEQLLTRQKKFPSELPKWAKELLDGKQLEFKEIYQVKRYQKPEFVRGTLSFRLLQLCRCCDTPLLLLSITLNNADIDIVDLLGNSVLINPGPDGTAQNTSVTISPGPDGTAQNTSLDIIGQNQLTFSADQHPPTTDLTDPEMEAESSLTNRTYKELYNSYKPLQENNKAVRVAIIDTGFDRALMEGPIQNEVTIWNKTDSSSCGLTNDHVGWNFVGKPTLQELIDDNAYGVTPSGGRIENRFENNNPHDDSPIEHGTLLAGLITQYAASTPMSLMILKAFDRTGKGTLFAVICAFCYAQANGADVINASFVTHASSGTDFLEIVIGDLERKGIIVVCAAGNRGSGSDNRGQLLTGQFFPACFSQGHKNVITTTSVWGADVYRQFGLFSPANAENYSPEYVNVGLLTNHPIRANEGYFKAPYRWYRGLIGGRADLQARWSAAGIDGVVGSSFATGIMTGIIAGILSHHRGIANLVGLHANFSGTDPRSAILSSLPHAVRQGVGLVINNVYVQA